MARPPLPVGTMGEIRCYKTAKSRFRAVAKYRDYDGVTRQVERTGKSDTQARNRLKEACRDRGRTDAAAEITPATTVKAVAEEWFSEIQAAVVAGDRSPSTAQAYRDRLDNQVIPSMGALRLREISVSRVDRVLKATREHHGVSVAKLTRTVLSGIFGLAVRHDAMDGNPVRDAAPVRTNGKISLSMELSQVWDLRAKVAADKRAKDWDLVDFIDLMLATGLRIGETLAITWAAVDLVAGTVEVRGTIIRVKGEGVLIKPKPKSKSGWRIIELPTWAVEMLKRRHDEHVPNEWNVVFTSTTGRLRDPSNTQGDLRQVFDDAGYPDITSHTFRRTVATLMDHAGLTGRAAADQLGHAKVSMTQDNYFGRRVRKTGAAGVLQAINEPEEEDADEDRPEEGQDLDQAGQDLNQECG